MSSAPRRDVVIVGAGGLGREVLWTLRHPETRVSGPDGEVFAPQILGFLDDNPGNHGKLFSSATVLGSTEWLANHSDVLVVVAVGIPAVRQRVVGTLREAGVAFASVVGPHSLVGDESHIGEGSILLPGVIVTSNVTIGEFVLLNPTVSVSHDCAVGDFTSLGPGVNLAGNVHVGPSCDIGTNASAIPGVRIGSNSVIGAGACVTRDLPDNVTAVGVPAKAIKIAESQ